MKTEQTVTNWVRMSDSKRSRRWSDSGFPNHIHVTMEDDTSKPRKAREFMIIVYLPIRQRR